MFADCAGLANVRLVQMTATALEIDRSKVRARRKGERGTVLKTSLDHNREAALQAALAEVKAASPV